MSTSSGDLSLCAAARVAAMSAADAIRLPEPASITFSSRGVVLVAGKAVRVMAALGELPPPLRVVAFVPDAAEGMPVPTNVRLVAAPILTLKGFLGCFSATSVPVNGEPADAGRFGWNEDRRFDLVLDLNEVPLAPQEVGPYGYFAPRTDEQLRAALAQIRGQPGSWRKPRYFDYRPDICAHGTAGVTGCTRCLDACPAGAIASAGDKVAFDPQLCHGCGTCTAVCPQGAVRYASPPADTMLQRLRAMLAAWQFNGAAPPRLVVTASSAPASAGRGVPANLPRDLVYEVPALASFGIEMWFCALAWGAAQIALVPDSTTAQASMRALSDELEVARAILSALGETTTRVVLADTAASIPEVPAERMGPVANALAQADKRATLYAAVDHLSQGRVQAKHSSRLPSSASFGAVTVNQERCTLCFACVNLCPTQALTSTEKGRLELRFTESHCVQCGLCSRGCPERAIDLLPRIQLDRALREEPRELCVDEPFGCIRCGALFIGKRMLGRSIEMMKGHPQLLEHGLERLKLCPSCRVQATLQDVTPGGE